MVGPFYLALCDELFGCCEAGISVWNRIFTAFFFSFSFLFFFSCPILFWVKIVLILLGAGCGLWNILQRKQMACRFGERGVMAAVFWEHMRRFRADKMLLCASRIWAEALEISMAKSLKLLAKMRSLHLWWFVRMHQHQHERCMWPDANVACKWSHSMAACSLCILWTVW